MTTDNSTSYFDELKEWSERKLQLLEKYLDGATKILGSIDRVWYVDGFAGRGTYGKPGQLQIAGSPLRAAQLAERFYNEGRSYSLRCVNIESDKDTFQDLQSCTAAYGRYVRNHEGQFTAHVDTILSEVKDCPVICFLDPFGVDGIDWNAVQKLIWRTKKIGSLGIAGGGPRCSGHGCSQRVALAQ